MRSDDRTHLPPPGCAANATQQAPPTAKTWNSVCIPTWATFLQEGLLAAGKVRTVHSSSRSRLCIFGLPARLPCRRPAAHISYRPFQFKGTSVLLKQHSFRNDFWKKVLRFQGRQMPHSKPQVFGLDRHGASISFCATRDVHRCNISFIFEKYS